MFSPILETLGAHNAVNTDVFALRTPKTTVFTSFLLPCIAEITVFTVFLCRAQQKTWYLRSFHNVARCSFCIRKGQKHCILRFFLRPERSKKSSNNCSKTVQNPLPKASYNFIACLFPAPDPHKRENTTSLKDFRGRRQARALV